MTDAAPNIQPASGRRSPLFFYAITAALAGFLFGFDTVVISGAEQSIEVLWDLTESVHGWAIGAALWGTVFGSLVGGYPTDRFGRRRTLIAVGVLYLVSAVWSALADAVVPFFIARFLGGIGVGMATVAAPAFISEIAPPDLRGRLTGLFQFNIVFGILAAFASNWVIGTAFLPQVEPGAVAPVDDFAWRLMLGVEAIPAMIYVLLTAAIPESPRWLLTRRNDREGAAATLARIEPGLTQAEIDARLNAIAVADPHLGEADLRPGISRLKLPLLLAFLIAMFNQLSGINVVLYYSKRIFEAAGFADNASLLASVGVGVANFIFTFVGLALIDRLGRRTLLIIGSVGYIASLGTCAWAFTEGQSELVAYSLFAFVAAHAIGQGAVIWVFISEIFPQSARGLGQSIGSGTHWVFAAALNTAAPALITRFGMAQLFWFFCGSMAVQLIWVLAMVPETKGIPLEDIEKRWDRTAA